MGTMLPFLIALVFENLKITSANNYQFPCIYLGFFFLSLIRIRIPIADPNPGGKMNADPRGSESIVLTGT